jgi:hypothetical protein
MESTMLGLCRKTRPLKEQNSAQTLADRARNQELLKGVGKPRRGRQ